MTKTTLALTLAALAGCALPKPTPYRPSTVQTINDDGSGYSDRPMAPGQFMLEVSVNKHTSNATLIEYTHRRAGELCPGGFEFGSNLVEQDGQGRKKATAVVICAEAQ